MSNGIHNPCELRLDFVQTRKHRKNEKRRFSDNTLKDGPVESREDEIGSHDSIGGEYVKKSTQLTFPFKKNIRTSIERTVNTQTKQEGEKHDHSHKF